MRIRNYKKFQHFKDRKPPWVKLHKDILEQRDIMLISACSYRLLTFLWLLASEDENMDGNLPELSDISFRIRIPEKEIVQLLQELTPWVDYSDISLISGGYQEACVETETETEIYKPEKRKDLSEYSDDFNSFWSAYPDKTGKGKANESWQKLKPPLETVLQSLQWQRETQKWREGFVPNPATYLNQRRWEDSPPVRERRGLVTFEEQKSINRKQAMVDFVMEGEANGKHKGNENQICLSNG